MTSKETDTQVPDEWAHQLDYSTDTISDDEWRWLLAWYRTYQGDDSWRLIAFPPFLRDYRPDVLKHLRRWVRSVGMGPSDRRIPRLAVQLCSLHYYAVRCYEKGMRYEIGTVRALGGTKGEVLDTLALAYLDGGSAAMNASALALREYLDLWPEQQPEQSPWPDGWRPTAPDDLPQIDLTKDRPSQEEIDVLAAWHLEHEGSVPGYIRLLRHDRPEAVWLFRNRIQHAARSLPVQMPPLMALHLAAIQQRPAALRRAAIRLRELGVHRAQVVDILVNAQYYLGETGLDLLADTLADLFDDWD